MGNICHGFELFARQATQMVAELEFGGIEPAVGQPIPAPKDRAQFGRKEMINRFVDAGGVHPFQVGKYRPSRQQCPDLAEFSQPRTNLGKIAFVTPLQFRIVESHLRALRQRMPAGPEGWTGALITIATVEGHPANTRNTSEFLT
jgi:lysylphosphatidylglycerol synthetase-like protein (DUF2156 family)